MERGGRIKGQRTSELIKRPLIRVQRGRSFLREMRRGVGRARSPGDLCKKFAIGSQFPSQEHFFQCLLTEW